MERSQVTCPDIIHVPVEKDDTDTLLCLKYGMELGYREFLMIGGIGGRLDHTMANIQTLLLSLIHISNYYTTVFRKNLGYTPSHYKKLLRQSFKKCKA